MKIEFNIGGDRIEATLFGSTWRSRNSELREMLRLETDQILTIERPKEYIPDIEALIIRKLDERGYVLEVLEEVKPEPDLEADPVEY